MGERRGGNVSNRRQRVFTKKYSDELVDRLKKLIQNQKERGDEKFFAIRVDDEFIVHKTSDPRYFDDYKEFLDGTTNTIEVILYYGRSNNCNRHIFYLRELPLNGHGQQEDVNSQIEDAIQRKDQEHQIERLKRKIKNLKAKVEKQEVELTEYRSKFDIKGILSEGLAFVQAFKGKSNDSTQLSGVEEESDVTIEPIDDSEPEDSDEQKETFDLLYKEFGKDEMKKMIGLMLTIKNDEEFRDKINKAIQEKSQKNTKS